LSRAGSPLAARRVAVAKPKNDIYVTLLAVALSAIVLGCILLAIEMARYNWKVKPEAAMATPAPAALPSAVVVARSSPARLSVG
jgi:hypothetical protein